MLQWTGIRAPRYPVKMFLYSSRKIVTSEAQIRQVDFNCRKTPQKAKKSDSCQWGLFLFRRFFFDQCRVSQWAFDSAGVKKTKSKYRTKIIVEKLAAPGIKYKRDRVSRWDAKNKKLVGVLRWTLDALCTIRRNQFKLKFAASAPLAIIKSGTKDLSRQDKTVSNNRCTVACAEEKELP